MAGVDTHNSPALEPQTQWLSWARAYLLQGCQPVVPQRLGSAACARIGNVLEGERDVEFRVSDRSCYDAESEDEGISSEDESISFDGSSGECPICLGTRGAGTTKVALRCSHVFCQDCLDQHIATALSAGRNAWCPLCREPLDSADSPTAAVAAPNNNHSGTPPPPPPPPAAAPAAGAAPPPPPPAPHQRARLPLPPPRAPSWPQQRPAPPRQIRRRKAAHRGSVGLLEQQGEQLRSGWSLQEQSPNSADTWLPSDTVAAEAATIAKATSTATPSAVNGMDIAEWHSSATTAAACATVATTAATAAATTPSHYCLPADLL
mmetsp:Transcript_73966/g.192059  ORF Transcript_73966/g.192059 Transcript_73966/m.192059 type:complete len:320 (-) Transcript_73966:125-1084(-)